MVTVKRPTENTDYLAARHISARQGNDYPFLCYKWDTWAKDPDISRENLWQANWERWDYHYRLFNPVKHPEPSSGTCAIYSVVERWNPDVIGLIGFDYVLDNNTNWFHDARAELDSILSLVRIIDLRDGSEIYNERRKPC